MCFHWVLHPNFTKFTPLMKKVKSALLPSLHLASSKVCSYVIWRLMTWNDVLVGLVFMDLYRVVLYGICAVWTCVDITVFCFAMLLVLNILLLLPYCFNKHGWYWGTNHGVHVYVDLARHRRVSWIHSTSSNSICP